MIKKTNKRKHSSGSSYAFAADTSKTPIKREKMILLYLFFLPPLRDGQFSLPIIFPFVIGLLFDLQEEVSVLGQAGNGVVGCVN